MNKLFEILRKNILLLVRSKTSALIVLLGPLVLILLISTAFNTTSLYDIKIGAYSDSYSSLSDSIMEQLNADEFKVEKLDSMDVCINSIKTNPQLKPFRDNNVTLVYYYKDVDGTFLTKFEVTPVIRYKSSPSIAPFCCPPIPPTMLLF